MDDKDSMLTCWLHSNLVLFQIPCANIIEDKDSSWKHVGWTMNCWLFQMTKIEIPERPVQFTDEELETQRLLMWQCYAHLTTPAIQNMVEFVKRVPGNAYTNNKLVSGDHLYF